GVLVGEQGQALLQGGDARAEGGGPLVQLAGAGGELAEPVGQGHAVDVQVELQLDAVEGDGRHGKVGDVGGHLHFAGLAGQQGEDDLPLAAHAGDGAPRRADVGGAGGVQGDGGLQGVLVKPVPLAGRVGLDVDPDDEGPAAAGQGGGVDLGPVQDIVDLDQPGQGGGGVHGALVVQVPVGGRGQSRRPVRVGDGVGGGHVAHGGVIA